MSPNFFWFFFFCILPNSNFVFLLSLLLIIDKWKWFSSRLLFSTFSIFNFSFCSWAQIETCAFNWNKFFVKRFSFYIFLFYFLPIHQIAYIEPFSCFFFFQKMNRNWNESEATLKWSHSFTFCVMNGKINYTPAFISFFRAFVFFVFFFLEIFLLFFLYLYIFLYYFSLFHIFYLKMLLLFAQSFRFGE